MHFTVAFKIILYGLAHYNRPCKVKSNACATTSHTVCQHNLNLALKNMRPELYTRFSQNWVPYWPYSETLPSSKHFKNSAYCFVFLPLRFALRCYKSPCMCRGRCVRAPLWSWRSRFGWRLCWCSARHIVMVDLFLNRK